MPDHSGMAMVSSRDLIGLAIRHHCLPLLVRGLELEISKGGGGDLAFAAELRQQAYRLLAGGASRAYFLSRRLMELMAQLTSRGYRALALKGPAMATLLYGHADSRLSDDLDIWIHPDDFYGACEWIESLGYSPLVTLSPQEARAHMGAGWDRAYRSPAGDYVIELCVGLAPRYFAVLPEPGDLWASAVDVRIEGTPVKTVGGASLMELLCVHGLKHGWRRLLWVADVAALCAMEGEGSINWPQLRSMTRRHGTTILTGLGLRMAGQCLGVSVQWEEPPRRLVRDVERNLSGESSCRGGWKEMRMHIGGRERWRDRVRYIVMLLFTPGYGDWRWMRLPPGLFWMYWWLRPLRLLSAAARRRASWVSGRRLAEG